MSAANTGWKALRHDLTAGAARAAMKASYRSMPAGLHPHLASLFDAFSGSSLPVLIHCTAGKDRTGVLIALLLTALGVSRDDVIEDYLRSTMFAESLQRGGAIVSAFEASFGFTPSEEAARTLAGVDGEYLDCAFDALTREWGSVENYLLTAGVRAARLERFRTTLLACA
jgi:protein-tyrosine phosphatase